MRYPTKAVARRGESPSHGRPSGTANGRPSGTAMGGPHGPFQIIGTPHNAVSWTCRIPPRRLSYRFVIFRKTSGRAHKFQASSSKRGGPQANQRCSACIYASLCHPDCAALLRHRIYLFIAGGAISLPLPRLSAGTRPHGVEIGSRALYRSSCPCFCQC